MKVKSVFSSVPPTGKINLKHDVLSGLQRKQLAGAVAVPPDWLRICPASGRSSRAGVPWLVPGPGTALMLALQDLQPIPQVVRVMRHLPYFCHRQAPSSWAPPQLTFPNK